MQELPMCNTTLCYILPLSTLHGELHGVVMKLLVYHEMEPNETLLYLRSVYWKQKARCPTEEEFKKTEREERKRKRIEGERESEGTGRKAGVTPRRSGSATTVQAAGSASSLPAGESARLWQRLPGTARCRQEPGQR